MPEFPPQFTEATLLLFVLVNPFLMSIYLLDLMEQLPAEEFRSVLLRGFAIGGVVFVLFAIFGDAVFSRVLQVRFAAFLVFGGAVFFLVGVRFVMVGSAALSEMRGTPESLAGSIALPFLIGPGTISASIFAGSKLPVGWAMLSIVTACLAALVGLWLLKWLHDFVRKEHERLVSRYVDIVGRVSALVIGTIAVEMVFRGIDLWISERQ